MASNTVTGSETPAAVPPTQPEKAYRKALIYIPALTYAVLVALTIHRHEPWADEAQAWLLGRDASLAQLWGHLLRYEGTPGLWQTLLHALIQLGLPYSAYDFVSAGLAFGSVVLLIRYAPLPLLIRILLPFTYYFCYQYAVIARSYALIAPILFTIAVLYKQGLRRPVLMTILLALLASVSVHGFMLSVCIWATLYVPISHSQPRVPKSERRSFLIASAAYCCVLIFFVVCAWPANDVAFAEHRGLSNLYLLPDVAKAGLAGAFTGYWVTSLALIALSAPLLWRGGGWLFFLLASAGFCLFGTIVYTQLWHFGILFLAWLFAIWISAYKTRVTAPTVLALIAAIGFQGYWAAAAIRYDWSHAYSGSLAAARYFQQAGLPPGGLYAIGYSTTAIQPYFPANIYSDFHEPENGAYWDWSKRNTANEAAALFGSDRRELVLVGYKVMFEKRRWADLLALLGYQVTQHFDGGTFWQTGVFESESYDLYRNVSAPHVTSSVSMADPTQAAQLLDGFYAIEGKKSRWTQKTFSVLLKAAPGAESSGAELTLKLYLPDAQVQKSGAMTLRAEVGGNSLPAQTFSRPDLYNYSAHVPAQALRSGFAVVNFRLDKSAVGLNGDARELGIVVISISLDSPSPAT